MEHRSALVGRKIRVLSLEFAVVSWDGKRRRYILRNTRTRHEHALPGVELDQYLADPLLKDKIQIIN